MPSEPNESAVPTRDVGDAATRSGAPPIPQAVTLTLLVVRHGITAWNAEGRLQGQTDIPLAPEGREQARQLGQRFSAAWTAADAASLARVPKPEHVFVSDLSRALDTALLSTQGLLNLPEAQFHVTPLLRERAFGPWEGLTLEEARVQFGDKRSHRDEGEPHAAVWERMGRISAEIWNTVTDRSKVSGAALVVGHGGSLRQFACQCVGLELSASRHFFLDNTGLSILELSGSSFDQRSGRILLWNDTSHLG